MLADKLPTRCAASRRAPATTRSMPFCGATRAAFSALHDSGGGQHPARRVALQRASARPSRSFATSSTSLRSSPNHSREWDSQPTRRGVGIFGRVRVPGVRARVRVRPTCDLSQAPHVHDCTITASSVGVRHSQHSHTSECLCALACLHAPRCAPHGARHSYQSQLTRRRWRQAAAVR